MNGSLGRRPKANPRPVLDARLGRTLLILSLKVKTEKGGHYGK